MGLDVVLFVMREPTPELVAKLDALFEPFRTEPWGRSEYPKVSAVTEYRESFLGFDDPTKFKPHVMIDFMDRYFGVGYARGWWPQIKDYIWRIVLALNETDDLIKYGHDCSEWAQWVDPDLLDELDALWKECEKGRSAP